MQFGLSELKIGKQATSRDAEEYSFTTGLAVADHCYRLVEVARDSLRGGQVEDARCFVQIICDDSEQLLLKLKTTLRQLGDAKATQEELFCDLNLKKKDLAAVEQMCRESITGHQGDMQDAEWLKDHLECLQHEADLELCRAERAHQESKNEKETFRLSDLIPFVGWHKNRSCDAKMAEAKQTMDEARKKIADAKKSRDVVDLLWKDDGKKVRSAEEKLRECEKKMAENHQLIGDLKLALSFVLLSMSSVERIVGLAGQACSNVNMLTEILDECLTRPAVGKSRGTELQFEHTENSWSEVRTMIRADKRLL